LKPHCLRIQSHHLFLEIWLLRLAHGQSDEAGQGPKKKQLEKAAWEGFIGS
jgi:hypothetical protein